MGFLHTIKLEHIANFVAERAMDRHPHEDRRIGKTTIGIDLQALHRCFNLAIEHRHCKENPVAWSLRQKFSTTGESPTMPFSEAEMERILAVANNLTVKPHSAPPEAVRAVTHVFAFTGLRLSDVADLRKSDVDIAKGIITRTCIKNGNTVRLTMLPELIDALQRHQASLPPLLQHSEAVFPERNGRPISKRTVAYWLTQVFKAANVIGGHPHRFRDTFAVKLLLENASSYKVGKLLGDTEAVVAKHYSPYTPELQDQSASLMMRALRFGKQAKVVAIKAG